MIRLMLTPAENLCEQAIWAISNIIGDGPDLRDSVIEMGFVQVLVTFVQPHVSLSLLRNVAWTISNVCRIHNPPPPIDAVIQILPALNQLIENPDPKILTDALWAVCYLTDSGLDRIDLVIESGVVTSLITSLSHADDKIQTAALRAIGNIATGSDDQTQFLLDLDVLAFVPELLSHRQEKIRKEAVWFLSNIAAGTPMQIQAVLDAGLLPKIIELLSKDNYLVKAEAAYVVCNAAKGGFRQQIQQLVRAGAIQALNQLLENNLVSPKINIVSFTKRLRKVIWFLPKFTSFCYNVNLNAQTKYF